jgi:phospholipase/carboxylesterase
MIQAGAPPSRAEVAVLMLHGRGADAASILTLADALPLADVAFLALEAPGGSWYPESFLAPLSLNEPALSSALERVAHGISEIEAVGIPTERVVLLGFSQGACLALESAARNARRYGGVLALSGGLIGNAEIPGAAPPDDKRFEYGGDLAGTPVFLGCSDVDPHIPLARLRRTTEVMRGLGGEVTERIYPAMGHTVSPDELRFAQGLLSELGGTLR